MINTILFPGCFHGKPFKILKAKSEVSYFRRSGILVWKDGLRSGIVLLDPVGVFVKLSSEPNPSGPFVTKPKYKLLLSLSEQWKLKKVVDNVVECDVVKKYI